MRIGLSWLIFGVACLYVALVVIDLVRSRVVVDVLTAPIEGLGSRWLPGALLIWANLAVLIVVLSILGSPLFALRSFNHLIGRPPPHGRLANWWRVDGWIGLDHARAVEAAI